MADAIDYTSALGIHSLPDADRQTLTAKLTALAWTRGGSSSPRARRVRSSWRFLAMFEPGDRVAVTVPRLSTVSPYPLRAWLRAGDDRDIERNPTCADRRSPARRPPQDPAEGVLVGSPANPTGTMMSREALAGLMSAAEGAGIRFISDEIYHGLDYAFARRHGSGAFPPHARHQLVLEVFLHDRLAGRLDGGAGSVGAGRSSACSRISPFSVPTLSQIRRRGRFRRPRGMEDVKHGYQENRRILIEGLPKAGLNKFLPADGAFYLYADVSEFTLRQSGICQADAGKGPCRGHPGRRFRPGSRPSVLFAFPMRARPRKCVRPWRVIARWLG